MHAAGLGRLTVLSGLGQPLRAEIEVVSLQKGEADSLQARLAPPEAFQQAGVEYAPVLRNLRFEVKQEGDGRYVIVMTSLQPVNDPFVDILVELDWSTGRLVRQFVFLLDPLEYQANKTELNVPTSPPQVAGQPAAPAAAGAPAAARPSSEAAASASAAASAAKPASRRAAPAAPAAAASAPAARPAAGTPAQASIQPGSQYQVKPGDTLARIAASAKPSDVSMEQMLIALYRSNEDAFINKNVNLLRVGKVLTMPSAEAAHGISEAEAHQTLVAQGEEWQAYRRSLADRAGRQPARDTSAGQTAGGRIGAEVRDSGNAPADRVRLGTEAAGKGAGAAANGDEATARERELREMHSRVQELEKNLKDMTAALNMKNEQLAALQKANEAAKTKAAATPQAAPSGVPDSARQSPAPQPGAAARTETPAPAVEAAKPPAAPVEPPKAETPRTEQPKAEAPKPAEPPQVEPPKPAVPAEPPQAAKPPGETAEGAAPPTPAVQPAPPPKPAPVAKPPVREEPGFFESLMDDLPLIGGVLAALLALLGGLFWYRRKKTDKIEDTLMSVAGTDASSVFGTTGGRAIDTAASSQQTDFSQSGIGAIDTDEVDPVAEADVYMAYGRDAQAEEILKEALQKDPSKHAVRGKLLEIYAARKDVRAFETTAGELYAATHGQGPEWERASALGAQLDPGNPMYGAAAPAGDEMRTDVVAPAAGAAAFGAAEAHDAAATPTLNEEETLIQPHLPEALDLPELKMPSHAGEDLGFDLHLGDAADKNAGSGLDLELPETRFETVGAGAGAPAGSAPGAAAPAAAAAKAPLDFGGINLDLGPMSSSGPAVADARWQEVATKLDLAKAYHEMGDRDGARELLGEVAKEGDAAQQQQAKKLLETIG